MGGKKEETDETRVNKARKKKGLAKIDWTRTEVQGITALGHSL